VLQAGDRQELMIITIVIETPLQVQVTQLSQTEALLLGAKRQCTLFILGSVTEKPVVDFLIIIIELFSLGVTLRDFVDLPKISSSGTSSPTVLRVAKLDTSNFHRVRISADGSLILSKFTFVILATPYYISLF